MNIQAEEILECLLLVIGYKNKLPCIVLCKNKQIKDLLGLGTSRNDFVCILLLTRAFCNMNSTNYDKKVIKMDRLLYGCLNNAEQ